MTAAEISNLPVNDSFLQAYYNRPVGEGLMAEHCPRVTAAAEKDSEGDRWPLSRNYCLVCGIIYVQSMEVVTCLTCTNLMACVNSKRGGCNVREINVRLQDGYGVCDPCFGVFLRTLPSGTTFSFRSREAMNQP